MVEAENVPRRPCILLGAGFSKAVSDRMPDMRGLARAVAVQLDIAEGELAPFGGDLEQWMSFLATPQPWLSEPDNLRNRATFLDASAAIHAAITEAERVTVASSPLWLRRFVEHVSELQASVLTFNYDLLFERTALQLGRGQSFPELYVAPVTERMKPGTSYLVSVGQSGRPVVELFKLHGSTNWLTGTQEHGGNAGIVIGRDPVATAASQGNRYSDLVPMIVPPVSAKDAFYANGALNAQWRLAAKRLAEASELIICGYSFPPTDLSTRALMRMSLRDGAAITVIDPWCDVPERVAKLFGSTEHEIRPYESIVDYVAALDVHQIEWGLAYGSSGYAAVIEVDETPLPPHQLPQIDPDGPPGTCLNEFVETRWPDAHANRRPSDRLGHEGSVGMTRRALPD